jgi:hypothetical protein
MLIRKMYNAESTDPASSSQPSIAELMAKQGAMTDNNKVIIPNVSKAREEAKAEESKAVESTNETSTQVESQAPETSKNESDKEPVKWQEVLRHQQPEEILKELGYSEDTVGFVRELKDIDPKMIQFLNKWKTDGGESLKEYLNEMTTDYSQMPSEEVMRRQLKEDYPKASEKQIDAIFKREIVDKYNLDSVDDDLVEEGKLLLDAVAEKYRSKLTEKQQEYLLPKYTQEQDNSEEVATQEFEKYKNTVVGNQLTQDLLQNKRLSIGEGDEKFNYSVQNPQAIVENLFDSNAWASKMFDIVKGSDGSDQYIPNMEKQLLVSAILEDHKGFLKEMAKYYKSVGGKAISDSLDNPSPSGSSQPSKSPTEPKSIAEWMAKSGKLS